MNSIAQTNQSEKQLSEKMQSFLSRYHVGRLLRSANAYKLRGFPVLSVFLVAFSTAFTQRSFFMQMSLQSSAIPFAKDTFYRFMNSCHIHWRRFTTMLAATIIESTLEPLTSADRINVLILDDSIYHRARSKKVELLARLYDHAKKEFSYGFRMLTLCWSDGNTLLPVSHTLLSTGHPPSCCRLQEGGCPFQRGKAAQAGTDEGNRGDAAAVAGGKGGGDSCASRPIRYVVLLSFLSFVHPCTWLRGRCDGEEDRKDPLPS